MLAPRRIMAGTVVAVWSHMAVYPHEYTSRTYATVAELAPLRWWAIALTIAGATMLATRTSIVPVIAVGALLTGWCFGLAAASFNGQSQSPSGFTFILGFLALLIWGAGRNRRA